MTVSFLENRVDILPQHQLSGGASSTLVGETNVALQEDSYIETIGDEAREIAIKEVGADMEAAYALWEQSQKPSDYNEAHRLQARLFDLVRGRSARMVAKLEAARGLA